MNPSASYIKSEKPPLIILETWYPKEALMETLATLHYHKEYIKTYNPKGLHRVKFVDKHVIVYYGILFY